MQTISAAKFIHIDCVYVGLCRTRRTTTLTAVGRCSMLLKLGFRSLLMELAVLHALKVEVEQPVDGAGD